MSRIAHRSTVVLLAVAAVLGLASCGGTTRIVYNSADPAILFSVDRHLALEGDQWQHARAAVARFHAWHRRNELPRYAALLADAAGRVERGLGRSDVQWGVQAVRTRYAALIDAAVRESVPVLDTLDAENVATLERKFAQDDAKRLKEDLAGDSDKRRRERVTALRKRFEEWTGPLDGAQVDLVRGFVDATADYPRHAHELRRQRQRELVHLLDRVVELESPPRVEDLRAALLAWGLERTPERRQREEHFVRLVLDLDRSLSATQRAHAVRRLGAYAEDARVLARGA